MSLKLTIFLKQFALKRRRIWTELKGRVSLLLTSPNIAAVCTLNTPKAHEFILLQRLPRGSKMATSGCKLQEPPEPTLKWGWAMKPHRGRKQSWSVAQTCTLQQQLLCHLHFPSTFKQTASPLLINLLLFGHLLGLFLFFFFCLVSALSSWFLKFLNNKHEGNHGLPHVKTTADYFSLFLKGILPEDGLGS